MRLRRRYAALLSFAVASASAVMLVRQARALAPAPDLVPVLFARAPVRALEAVSASAVEVRRLPREAVPETALTSPEAAAGKLAAQDVLPGQILLSGMLTDTPVRRGLLRGEVALEVPLGQGSGLYLRPGDRVDVIATVHTNAPKAEPPQEPASLLVARGLRIVTLKASSGADVDPDKPQPGLMGVAGGPAVAVLAVPAELVSTLVWHVETAKVRLVVNPWAP
ncbi:Flp pilus assembly protein CpaB [Caldinitratiruptor microaerophilus]|uniref:SAF domain-containing protein n=1 Tax=Caldinitratiruptor microaerophilus TaxID=671077 RepID=A0AA35CM97_9FIRM|nr:RcpC/CpaB family pilus assembly protein [Caldinitratiruptor microaerophilus]BDG59936.1 hypothetical protein caldi_10260 [Caldinitratiruptor microaerophilus]